MDYILIHNFWFFQFFWVIKGYFNKHCYNFDDGSKSGYSKSSWNKGIFE